MKQRQAMDIVPVWQLLQAARSEAQKKHAWRQFGIAVHYLVKHWVLQDKPKLVQRAEPGRLDVYGQLFVANVAGQLKSNVRNARTIKIRDLGTDLLSAANRAIWAVYFQRMRAHVKDEVLRAGLSLKVEGYESSEQFLSSSVEWAMREFQVRWWSRKTSPRVEALTLSKLIWDNQVVDKETFGLMVRIGGIQGDIERYNACAGNKESLLARVKEAPNLAPLLLDDNREIIYPLGKGEDPASPGWHGSVFAGDDAFQRVREQFLAQGGTPAAWRWLSRQGWQVIYRYFRRQDWNQAIPVANVLAHAQVGKVPAVNALLQRSRYELDRQPKLAQRYAEAARLFSKAYQLRKQPVGELKDQWPLVWDYVRANYETLSLHKATWQSLVRRQNEWHRARQREVRERDKASRGSYAWQALVQEVELKGFKATSLNTSDELWAEGDAMHHCVGGYHYQCYYNTSRIYSIVGTEGHRVATMEVRLHGSKWSMTQLYAAHNRRIENPMVKKLAARVVALCNKAKKLDRKDNVVLRVPEKLPVTTPIQGAQVQYPADVIPF